MKWLERWRAWDFCLIFLKLFINFFLQGCIREGGRTGVEIGGREKETRRQRRREKHEGQYEKISFLQVAKADKRKKWVISWRKTSCSAQFGWWAQMKALWAGMLHIPAVPLSKITSFLSSFSHPSLKPALESSVGRLGWHRGSLCPTAFPPPKFTPSLPFSSFPPKSQQPLPAKPFPNPISFFSAGTCKTAKRLGAGGAKSWLAFSYVMDEHTPLMLLKRFNVWYSPNAIKGTKNWKQGMFTITGTWRAVMSHGKINFPPRMHFLGRVSVFSSRLAACTCFNVGMEERN